MVRAHPDEAHGERRRHARADASSQTRSTPLAHHGPAPRQAPAQGYEARSGRANSSRSTPSSSTSLPTRPSSTSRLTTRWRSGPSPSSPAAQPRAAPQPSSTSLSPRSPSASRASKSMAARSSGPSSRTHAESATCASSSCRRSGLSSTATSNAPKARGDTSSTASKTSRPASNRSSSASTPSPIASITQGLTKLLAISPQPSTSQPSARRSPRLIWAELGHPLPNPPRRRYITPAGLRGPSGDLFPGALSILKGAVPDPVPGPGHTAPTYVVGSRDRPPTTFAAPRFPFHGRSDPRRDQGPHPAGGVPAPRRARPGFPPRRRPRHRQAGA